MEASKTELLQISDLGTSLLNGTIAGAVIGVNLGLFPGEFLWGAICGAAGGLGSALMLYFFQTGEKKFPDLISKIQVVAIGFVGLILIINPKGIQPLSTYPLLTAVSVVACILIGLGLNWMHKLLTPAVALQTASYGLVTAITVEGILGFLPLPQSATLIGMVTAAFCSAILLLRRQGEGQKQGANSLILNDDGLKGDNLSAMLHDRQEFQTKMKAIEEMLATREAMRKALQGDESENEAKEDNINKA